LSHQSQSDIPESERQRRRQDKARASAIESSDEEKQLRDAVARSLEDRDIVDSDGEGRRPNVWDESARHVAAEVVVREREAAGQNEAARQRREAILRNEHQLRDKRVEDNALIAEEMVIKELAEAEDRCY
jgi:hypothetical protein